MLRAPKGPKFLKECIVTNFRILFDEPHEAIWFKALHPDFSSAKEFSITSAKSWPSVSRVLAYDRPDIILMDGDVPILVVEETVEVPSGHNVGQRFARIAAAAEAGVPCLYFGPYVARKHGGETEGPRYMNLRLFGALDAMERVTGSAVTTVNWPVDAKCEVRRDKEKDSDVKEYVAAFLNSYYRHKDLRKVNQEILKSPFHSRMVSERDQFISEKVRRADQYDLPPTSVEIILKQELISRAKLNGNEKSIKGEIVLYNIGMNNIRSDPYTGMAILYRYLYVMEYSNRSLILWFPNISKSTWVSTAISASRKDIRLYKIAADGILFADGFLSRSEL